jgi:hypothetical protein
MTSSDMSAVLGFERQKELLGCAEGGCLAELGAAMGFDGLVVGTVGKVDGHYSLVVKVIKPSDASSLAAYSQQGLTAKGLEQALARAAWELTSALAAVPGSSVARPAGTPPLVLLEGSPARVPWRPLAFIPGVLGLGGIGLGAYLHLQAGTAWTRLNSAGLTLSDANTALQNGLDAQNAERACFAVGGTLVAAAVVMFALGGSSDTVTPVAWVDGHGAMFGLAGALP